MLNKILSKNEVSNVLSGLDDHFSKMDEKLSELNARILRMEEELNKLMVLVDDLESSVNQPEKGVESDDGEIKEIHNTKIIQG